ncbi:MAG TPA: hypothetical protein DDZ51_04025 [Planctomycetaceae bacterium]|nr:hypothetical protein [Planctomycetaceae bacterium]
MGQLVGASGLALPLAAAGQRSAVAIKIDRKKTRKKSVFPERFDLTCHATGDHPNLLHLWLG